jgi:transcriptional regulator with XRE-family HTH domain
VARFDADPQLNALGDALAALRREAGLSQAEAGARVGMTSQGWGLYESGRRPGLFRPDVQRRLTAAIGATPEALTLRLPPTMNDVAAPTRGVEAGSSAFVPAPVPREVDPLERMTLIDDDLAPWAEAGVTVEFDPSRWPRRGQGCVIDLLDGTRLVRLFDGADADRLHLRGGPAGLEARSSVDRGTVRRVCAVIARRES